MIKCKIDWFASKEQPCKVFGPSEKQCRPQNLRYFLQKDRGLWERDCPRNGWWGERVEKKLCERLGTSLDLNPEVGKKRKFREVDFMIDCERFVPPAEKL